MKRPISSVLAATGSSLPSRVVPNDEFVAFIDTSDEWIRTRTGIRERRFAIQGESSASLGIDASRKALAKAGLAATDLDMIICATVTPDMMTPANACMVQTALGCRPIPAFDISAACTGFLYALSVADQFVQNGICRHVLVVGAEVLSRAIDLSDRYTCIIFGDGAGAVILSRADSSERGIQHMHLFADGGDGHLIQVPGMVTVQPPGQLRQEYVRMNGREVFRFAVTRMIELIEEALCESQKVGRPIDLLIPHQVNQRIIDAALERTGFPANKVMVNLDRYGNTSAASIPIALDEALATGRVKVGETVLLVAFGGGLTWGSATITL
jgi:3-oxoacyl-[acyl-carrier-protein] synthase-3